MTWAEDDDAQQAPIYELLELPQMLSGRQEKALAPQFIMFLHVAAFTLSHFWPMVKTTGYCAKVYRRKYDYHFLNMAFKKKVVWASSGQLAMKHVFYTGKTADILRQKTCLSNRDSVALQWQSCDSVSLSNNHTMQVFYFRCRYETLRRNLMKDKESGFIWIEGWDVADLSVKIFLVLWRILAIRLLQR